MTSAHVAVAVLLLASCGKTAPKPELPAPSAKVPVEFLQKTQTLWQDLAVGGVANTCAFQVTADGSLYLRPSTMTYHCIKVRRDPDGFVAVIPRYFIGHLEPADKPDASSMPVVRIEWE